MTKEELLKKNELIKKAREERIAQKIKELQEAAKKQAEESKREDKIIIEEKKEEENTVKTPKKRGGRKPVNRKYMVADENSILEEAKPEEE